MTISIVLAILAALAVLYYAAVPRRAAPSAGGRIDCPAARSGIATTGMRIATYNIHGAKGTDGVRDLNRTARVLEQTDIVALQEVRAGWRSDQARQLGRRLGLGWLFVPTLRRWYRDYRGNALLFGFPVKRWQTFALPSASGRRYRAYTVAEVAWNNATLSVLFTHLHTRRGRERQLEIVSDHFLRLPQPAVLLADLNTPKDDPAAARLVSAGCADAIAVALGARDPADRVDWIITRGLEIVDGDVVGTGVSDHPYFRVTLDRLDNQDGLKT